MAVRPWHLGTHVRTCRLTATCFLTPDELETSETDNLKAWEISAWTKLEPLKQNGDHIILEKLQFAEKNRTVELWYLNLTFVQDNVVRDWDTEPDWKSEKQRDFKRPETAGPDNTATTETPTPTIVSVLENRRLHRDWKPAGVLWKAAVSNSRLCCILGMGPGTWHPGTHSLL